MNTEQSDELARRAAMHAALADQARLLITDRLAEGDASPSELGTLLAMPSNLLAHHLRVLEDARIITRRRSEGDHRRSYLRLVPGALGSLTAPPRWTASRVLFVRTANSARSHLAAALWRQASPVPATSAGTHPAGAIHPGALDAARRHDLPLPRRCPPAPQRHAAGRRPHNHRLRPRPRGTRPARGAALVRPRPGTGRRPRQLRRGPGRLEPASRPARPAGVRGFRPAPVARTPTRQEDS